ncbi:MAG: hypothetical protein AB7J34_09985 [Limisphaerales bacterium]
MKRFLCVAAAVTAINSVPAALGVGFDVSALTPTLFPGNDWNTIGPGLYKADSPNPADESDTDPYDRFGTLFNVNGDGKVTGGTVTFNVPSSTLDIDFFVVKAGNEYAKFDTSAVDWSLYDSIIFGGFIQSAKPSKGAKSISHISLYGSYTPPLSDPIPPQTPTPVPDGGWTLGLLGMSALGLFLKHRR